MYIQDLLSWEQFNDENLSFFNAIGELIASALIFVVCTALTPHWTCEMGIDRTDFFEGSEGEDRGSRTRAIQHFYGGLG